MKIIHNEMLRTLLNKKQAITTPREMNEFQRDIN